MSVINGWIGDVEAQTKQNENFRPSCSPARTSS